MFLVPPLFLVPRGIAGLGVADFLHVYQAQVNGDLAVVVSLVGLVDGETDQGFDSHLAARGDLRCGRVHHHQIDLCIASR